MFRTVNVTKRAKVACGHLQSLEPRVLMAAPANDDFADRVTIRGASAVADGTTVDATRETGEPRGSTSDRGSVWFAWKAPKSGGVVIELDNELETDLRMHVYQGKALTSLAPVVTSGFFDVGFVAKAGSTYQIAVTTDEGDAGDFTLAIDSGLPVISVKSKDAVAAETKAGQSPNPGSVVFSRTGPLTHPLSIRYFTFGDSKERFDYVGLSDVARFPAGKRSVVVGFRPIDDAFVEDTEELTFSIGSASLRDYVGHPDFAKSGADVEIRDNDSPPASARRVAPDALALPSGLQMTSPLSPSGIFADRGVLFPEKSDPLA